jgi:Na+-driven multidrug efflux pump
MVATLAGALLNIIFDPILIFGLRWGMMGAAVATDLGQVVTAVLSVWYLCHMKAIRLERSSFRLHPHLMRRYLPLGICSFLSQISLVASMAAVQNMTVKYSALDEIFSMAEYSHIPMAVLGIVMKFFQIVISISVGTAAGCIPIVGYNVGANRLDRARELFQKMLIAEALIGFVATLIVEFFPGQLMALFGAGNESAYYTEYGIKCFRTYLCMMTLATVNKGTFIYLQSLGKAFLSTLLSMVREIVFGVALPILLPLAFALDGVLYSMPVADVLTFLISAVVIVYIMKLLSKPVPSPYVQEDSH